MTRIFTDGAEMGDTLFFDYVSAMSTQLVSTYGGSGVYVYQIGDTNYGYRIFASLTECYFRCRVRGDPFTKNDGNEAKHFAFYKDTTAIAWFGPDHSGHFAFYVNGTQVATDTVVRTDATWYLLEGYFKMSDTSGSGILKVNGITVIEYGGDTKPGTDAYFNRFYIQGAASNMGTPYTRWDDFALNDTSGSIDNSWCGAGRVEILKPNLDGDVLQWTASSGSHYQCLDDIPSNGDTDYINAEGDSLRNMSNVEAYTETNKTVERVWAEGRAKDNSAQAKKIAVGIKTSGSVFVTDNGQFPSAYKQLVSENWPRSLSTGNKWSKIEIDAMQVVVESVP